MPLGARRYQLAALALERPARTVRYSEMFRAISEMF
eukprot:SAG31_NODE_2235_length_6123_cov_2.723274_3_plen_36_part_00